MKKYLIFVFGLFFSFVIQSQSQASILLQLTIDQLTQGRAVLSGDLDDAVFVKPTPEATYAVSLFEVTGINWYVRARVFKDEVGNNEFNYSLTAGAKHISDPAPHSGEASPGLLFGETPWIFHHNLKGFGAPITLIDPGPLNKSHSLIHPGSEDHYDVINSHVDDLVPGLSAIVDGNNQISARFDLAHTPEPATLALFGMGLAGAALRKKRKA